jgi:hypothetical protein
LTVNFTDLSSNDPTSWSWNFGDGGTASIKNPTHIYTASGVYTVTLTATNSSGSDVETKVNYITVTALQPPAADFTASATTINEGQSVNFTDTSTGNPTSWSWTYYGGGTWSASSNELDGYHASAYTYAISPAGAVADGTISVDLTAKTDGSWTNGQIVFGWQDANNYCLADCRVCGNKWRLRQCVNGSLSNKATTLETINPNQLYQLELVIGSGGMVTLYVDGASKVSFDFGSVISGEAGVSVQQARSVFDNFCVTGTAAGQ